MSKNKSERVILVDADMICYRACSSCEREIDWGDDKWSLHVDLNEAIQYLQNHMDTYIARALELDQFEGNVSVIYCFSDRSGNIFRKKILPTYKLNRQGKRKPVAYWALKKWVEDNCQTQEVKHLEADDVMGILATGTYKGQSIILSGDKDMASIPTKVYNFIQDTLFDVSKEEAVWKHYFQTLVGDTADNYKGCPKIGEVKATKLLDEKGASWDTVLTAFKANGLTEQDALVQARVSYILQAKDYVKGKIKLWKPEDNQ